MALTGDKPSGEAAGTAVRPAKGRWPVAGLHANRRLASGPQEVRPSAEATGDLKSRWLGIGAAADHPLLDWFIQHQSNPRTRRRGLLPFLQLLGIVVFAGLIITAVVYTGIGTSGRLTFWSIFGCGALVAAVLIVRKRTLKPRRLDLARPIELITDAGNIEQWSHAALLPLSLRDLAGVYVGLEYWRARHRAQSWWRRLIVFLLAAAFLAYMAKGLSERVTPMMVLLMVASGAALMWSFFRYTSGRVKLIQQALSDLEARIVGTTNEPRAAGGRIRDGSIFLIWHTAWIANMNGVLIMMDHDKSRLDFEAKVALISMLAWTVICVAAWWRSSRRNLDRLFEEWLARVEPYYHRLVDRALGREDLREAALASPHQRSGTVE